MTKITGLRALREAPWSSLRSGDIVIVVPERPLLCDCGGGGGAVGGFLGIYTA